jgi:AcrR family transcriptional regulator
MVNAKRPRHRRGPDTLERILVAARNEFSTNGLSGAKIEAIARDAGVTKQSIYYYYGSKGSLYEAVYQYTSEECIKRVLQMDFLAHDPIEAILLFFGTIFDLHLERPYLLPMGLDLYLHRSAHIESIAVHRKAISLYEKLVDRAISKRLLHPNIDKGSCYSIAMLIVRGSLVRADKIWGYELSSEEHHESLQMKRGNALTAIRAILMSPSLRLPDRKRTARA